MSKVGFIYYKNDTNRYQDIKIKRLKKDFKGIGVCVHDYILNEIYRDKGYFIKWDDNLAFDVAEYWGICEDDVNKVVAGCCQIGLFNLSKFNQYGIITSKAIQVRYIEWSKQAKRAAVFIPEEYQVLPEELAKLPEETPKTPEKLDATPKLPEETDIVEYSIVDKSKEEERKVAESIEVNLSDTPTGAPTDQKVSINKWIEGFDKRKIEFQESLYPYTFKPPKYNGSYEPAMLKEFFDYWTEPNKSRSKMRWEQEKTWELPLRLSRWAANQKTNKITNQNKTGNVHQTTIPAAKSGFRVQGGK